MTICILEETKWKVAEKALHEKIRKISYKMGKLMEKGEGRKGDG